MIEQQIVVGAVAMVLGGVCVSAAVFNWQWYYELHKSRWVESLCGRIGARVVNALIGAGLIGLGCAIAAGFGPNA
ncbi:MAG: immunity 17 family protein [Pirellulaceae bacterium]